MQWFPPTIISLITSNNFIEASLRLSHIYQFQIVRPNWLKFRSRCSAIPIGSSRKSGNELSTTSFCRCWTAQSIAGSMTRLGDLLDFGQLFKAFSSNYFTQINLHCYAIFVKLSKSFIFLVKSLLGNFYRDIWRYLSGHTDDKGWDWISFLHNLV